MWRYTTSAEQDLVRGETPRGPRGVPWGGWESMPGHKGTGKPPKLLVSLEDSMNP